MPVPSQAGPQPAAPTSGPAQNPLAALLRQRAAPIQKPAPTHAQTVAALMHLSAVQEMLGLTQLPELGKANIRPEIYDATAELMAQGLVTLPQVMTEIRNIPADPPGQRTWVTTHLRNIALAKEQILSDHAQAFPGNGDVQSEMASIPPQDQSVSHVDNMKSIVNHYSGRRR